MQDSEGRGPDFLSQLLGGARESVHLEAVCFRDCPPWGAEGSLSRPWSEGRCGRGRLAVYMTQNEGRGAIAPISTLSV